MSEAGPDTWTERLRDALGRPYYRRLHDFVGASVPPGGRVLHLGCENGSLLASLSPSLGVGVGPSAAALTPAARAHPDLNFVISDPERPPIAGTFDHIIVTNIVGHMHDVWRFLRTVRDLMHDSSTLVITHYNYLWEPVLWAAEKTRLKRSARLQNWLPVPDLVNLVELANLEPVEAGYRDPVPLGPRAFSETVARLPLGKRLGLASYVKARAGQRRITRHTPKATVVIPTRNEKGNIVPALERLPRLSQPTEVIFVDGNSTDGTVQEIETQVGKHEGLDIKLILQGQGIGKGDAVRKGFAAATGDILLILDADLTVAPEELPKFWTALSEGRGDFINGTRLVYPMEKDAMRIANILGNKIFGLVFSWILGQRITDTLCGTKVLRRIDYERIAAERKKFGDFDPFGDFDLLFGAANIELTIREVPIRYRARTYGVTNIDRWRHGLLLLRMAVIGARKLRFR